MVGIWSRACMEKNVQIVIPDNVATDDNCRRGCAECEKGLGPHCCGCFRWNETQTIHGCGGFCGEGFCKCSIDVNLGPGLNNDGNYVPAIDVGTTFCKSRDFYYSTGDPHCNMERSCPGMPGFYYDACPVLKLEGPFPLQAGVNCRPCRDIHDMIKAVFAGANKAVWQSEIQTLKKTIGIESCSLGKEVSKDHLKTAAKNAMQSAFSKCGGFPMRPPMPTKCPITYAYTVAAN